MAYDRKPYNPDPNNPYMNYPGGRGPPPPPPPHNGPNGGPTGGSFNNGPIHRSSASGLGNIHSAGFLGPEWGRKVTTAPEEEKKMASALAAQETWLQMEENLQKHFFAAATQKETLQMRKKFFDDLMARAYKLKPGKLQFSPS